MGILRIVGQKSDAVIVWELPVNKIRPINPHPSQAEAVEQAEEIFRTEKAKGARAFVVQPGKAAQMIDQFDAHAEQIVLVPSLAQTLETAP